MTDFMKDLFCNCYENYDISFSNYSNSGVSAIVEPINMLPVAQ